MATAKQLRAAAVKAAQASAGSASYGCASATYCAAVLQQAGLDANQSAVRVGLPTIQSSDVQPGDLVYIADIHNEHAIALSPVGADGMLTVISPARSGVAARREVEAIGVTEFLSVAPLINAVAS